MTDRTISLIVALDKEMRIDDVQSVIDAIKMIKRVENVTANIFTGSDQMNSWASQETFKRELISKLLKVFRE
jgi:hypothetical protein